MDILRELGYQALMHSSYTFCPFSHANPLKQKMGTSFGVNCYPKKHSFCIDGIMVLLNKWQKIINQYVIYCDLSPTNHINIKKPLLQRRKKALLILFYCAYFCTKYAFEVCQKRKTVPCHVKWKNLTKFLLYEIVDKISCKIWKYIRIMIHFEGVCVW